MKISRINFSPAAGSYDIHLGPLIFKALTKNSPGNFAVVLSNKRIFTLHKKKITNLLKNTPHKFVFTAEGEQAKTKEWFFRVIDNIISIDKLDRKVFLICLGGGVIGDLGGFIASVYKRGIPYIQIPTTLLACVDSSVGGKTAINSEKAKNILGTFYPPKAVFVDPAFLATLPEKELKQGLAEVIKYAVIRDKELFGLMETQHEKIVNLDPVIISGIITRCLKIKAVIVEKDERETKGIRTVLNFGHTIGHALETYCQYRGNLPHGQAVALGMICAGYISLFSGLCGEKTLNRLIDIIRLYGLPVKLNFDTGKVLKSLLLDKKFVSGNIRMVLIEKIGKTKIQENIPLPMIRKALKKIYQ